MNILTLILVTVLRWMAWSWLDFGVWVWDSGWRGALLLFDTAQYLT
jgi:hypothetical protein